MSTSSDGPSISSSAAGSMFAGGRDSAGGVSSFTGVGVGDLGFSSAGGVGVLTFCGFGVGDFVFSWVAPFSGDRDGVFSLGFFIAGNLGFFLVGGGERRVCWSASTPLGRTGSSLVDSRLCVWERSMSNTVEPPSIRTPLNLRHLSKRTPFPLQVYTTLFNV